MTQLASGPARTRSATRSGRKPTAKKREPTEYERAPPLDPPAKSRA